ncbi:MAG: 4Fe-4S dicluster domain-containing protein [Treponema sp.]|nr:4Fe-4S dicluster domain-containing protein [Treponema sp.]
MIASFILTIMMSFIVMFFVAGTGGFSLASLIYSVFLIALFSGMTFSEHRKKGSGVIFRRIFRTVFAVGFCAAFISDLYAERGSMAITSQAMSNAELPFCHIAIPQALLPLLVTKNIIFPARISGHYAAVASMILIWLVCTLILGRGWCSWVCFYGGWEEGFSHLAKKPRIKLLPKNKEIRELHFGFFFFIVLASLCQMACAYCEWFCPFKLVTEYSPVNSIPSLIATIIFVGLFVGLVIVLPILTKKRTQCSALCPFGAFASLTDRFSAFRMKIDTEKCVGCMKCAASCPFSAIDIKTIQEKKGRPEITCAKCGECVAVCPQGAISYGFKFNAGRSCAASCSNNAAPKSAFGRAVQELLNPAQLFRFAAFSFATIMSSGFMVKSLNLAFNLIGGIK